MGQEAENKLIIRKREAPWQKPVHHSNCFHLKPPSSSPSRFSCPSTGRQVEDKGGKICQASGVASGPGLGMSLKRMPEVSPVWCSFLFINAGHWILHNSLEIILRNVNLLITLKQKVWFLLSPCNPARPALEHCWGSRMASCPLRTGGTSFRAGVTTPKRKMAGGPLDTDTQNVQFKSTKHCYWCVPGTVVGTVIIMFKNEEKFRIREV